MKRSFTITVDIDTDRDPHPPSQGSCTFNIFSGNFRIDIGRGPFTEPTELIAILTHEIGHAIAWGLDLPHAHAAQVTGNYENASQKIVAVEVEAWNVAARVFRAVRHFGLSTYEHEHGIQARNIDELLTDGRILTSENEVL